ncbi:MAG: beta-galactosidase [Bacteroidota bacterium]|nr:beta-galactosidase [Bacteroidota bacterium]
MTLFLNLLLGVLAYPEGYAQTTAWTPVEGNIMSKWAADVQPQNVLNEYPRPQMVRQDWLNLNGLWDFSILSKEKAAPSIYNEMILVPFAVESALSGIKKGVGKENRAWYQRNFEVPTAWKYDRLLLHFGAVDWEAKVYINGKEAGQHQGGYDSFYFDITDFLIDGNLQQLTVSVWDPTSEGPQPRGKQVVAPEGIWYTPVTGIWQTVWLEPVQSTFITSFKSTPNIDNKTLTVKVSGNNLIKGDKIRVTAYEEGKVIATNIKPAGNLNTIQLKNIKLWSPESPFLYDLKIEILRGIKVIDAVDSYFGMRKISLKRDHSGIMRIMLNNKFQFQYGTLDQGWWPDGLYTAPTDAALVSDIEVTKKLGFNMIRKHVKVEPARWYYHCDKLGMLVWQDMPNGDESAQWEAPGGINGIEMERSEESAKIFEREFKAMIDALYNAPSIVMWVPFNEGWGQFNTVMIIKWAMAYDPTRLINGPSGGNHFLVGHTIDHHQYPGPAIPPKRSDQALVLGEFGGLGLPMEGHLWQKDKNWGYKDYNNVVELTQAYLTLINQLPELIHEGLSAAIYTQTTDVEGEVNGLMTYDRKIIKFDPIRLNRSHKVLFFPLTEEKAIAPATN